MMKNMYDFLLVGAGWFNATLAHILSRRRSVFVIDRRPHIGGNCHTENRHNINIHKYGAHIFHSNNKLVWDFVNNFAEFNRYTQIFEKLLKGSTVLLNTPYNSESHKAKTIIYSGAIDEYFDYRFGELEYRSLRFETKTLECENYQGNGGAR